MRVSKLFWVNGPEPEPTKLLRTVLVWGAGNAPRIFPAAGEILSIGIRFPAKGSRFAPVFKSPVRGSYTCPACCVLPGTPAVRYSLKSQNPGVALAALVAGLQLC